jgi:hypothetical protein
MVHANLFCVYQVQLKVVWHFRDHPVGSKLAIACTIVNDCIWWITWYMYMYSLISLSSPPHIYVSKCVYVYVHISLFLPEYACTTIIDISPRIFSLMYCCCVSIIFVNCICPPGALIWLINLFLFKFLFLLSVILTTVASQHY